MNDPHAVPAGSQAQFSIRKDDVVLKSAPEVIGALEFPVSRTTVEHLRDMIAHEGEELADAFRRTCHREAAESEIRAEAAAVRLAEGRELCRVAEVERQARAADGGSWAKASIFAISVAACFAAEFVLTWQALTFVLSVNKHSVLGVLLGVAPPCALAVLEVIIWRLLEEPWKRLHAARQFANWKSWCIHGVMALFMIGLAWENLRTVLLLAQAREEAARVQYALALDEGGGKVELNPQVISDAVIAVSACVTLDGALLLLLCLAESHALAAMLRARRKAAALSRDLHVLETVETELRAGARVCRRSWEECDKGAMLVAARFRHQCLFQLEDAVERLRTGCPDEKRVHIALRLARTRL